jgi:hypothetical protein
MVNVVVAPPIASAGPHPKGIDITQTRVALRALPWGAVAGMIPTLKVLHRRAERESVAIGPLTH